MLLAIKSLGLRRSRAPGGRPGGGQRLTAPSTTRWPTSSTAEDALAATIAAGGTPVHSLGATGNLDLRWMAAFRRLLLERPFDIVHFHLPYTAALGRLVVATLPRRIDGR